MLTETSDNASAKELWQALCSATIFIHDEALFEYFDRNSLKQHIIQKPIRFGYECFCLNTPSGYLIAFDFCHSRKGNYHVALAEEFGKNAATVLALLRFLPESLKDLAFHISQVQYEKTK